MSNNVTNSPPIRKHESQSNLFLDSPLDKNLLDIFKLTIQSSFEECYNSVIQACVNVDLEPLKITNMSDAIKKNNKKNLKYFSFLFEAGKQIEMVKRIFSLIINNGKGELNAQNFEDCSSEKWKKIHNVSTKAISVFCKTDCSSIFECLLNEGESLELILENGLREVLVLDPFHTILHLAIKIGRLEHIPVLLGSGLKHDQQESFSTNHLGQIEFTEKIPLHVAIEVENKEMIRYFIDTFKLDLEKSCKYKSMELSLTGFAVALGKKACLDVLAELLPTSWTKFNQRQSSLLLVAIHFDQYCMLKHLLTHYSKETRCFLESADSQGRTPLILATCRNNVEAFDLLWKMGANIEAKDAQSKTALDYAAEAGNLKLVKSIVDKNAHIPLHPTAKATKSIQNYLENIAAKDKKNHHVFAYANPENLVLQGGGLRGLAFIGAIDVLEKRGKLENIKRIAGSREGAIVAIFLALGYTTDEIKKMLEELKLELIFGKEISIPDLKNLISDKKELEKQSEGVDFWKWIENKIYIKTEKKLCSFGELKQTIGHKSSHFYTFLVQKDTDICTTISSEDDRWKDLIISDVLCAAVAIPGISKPWPLSYKDDDGERYVKNSLKMYFGCTENQIACFDYGRYVNNRELTEQEMNIPINNPLTLGLHLCSRANQRDDAISPLVKVCCNTPISSSLEKSHRLIKIHSKVEEDGLLAFMLTLEQENELIDSSKNTTLSFFKDEASCARSAFGQPSFAPLNFDQNLKLPNQNFSGRTTELKKIEEAFFSEEGWGARNQTKQFLIYGARGMGKSTLACKFANNCIHQVSLVHWIDYGAPKEKLEQAYQELATRLDIPISILNQKSQEEIRKFVFRKLENHSSAQPWLLIFDNVENEAPLLNEYPKRGGIILYTAKNDKILPLGMRLSECYLQLNSFSKQEGKLFLKKCLKYYSIDIEHEDSITDMIECLGTWPFLLKRAVAHMNNLKIKVDQYLEQIKPSYENLLSYSPSTNNLTVLDIFRLRLKALSPLSLSWIYLMLYLSEKVSEKWMIYWLKSMEESRKNQQKIELELYDFISRVKEKEPKEKEFIAFKPLIKEMLNLVLRDVENEKFKETASFMISFKLEEDLGEWALQMKNMIENVRFKHLDMFRHLEDKCIEFLHNPKNLSKCELPTLDVFIELLKKIAISDGVLVLLYQGHLFRAKGDLIQNSEGNQVVKRNCYEQALKAYMKAQAYDDAEYVLEKLEEIIKKSEDILKYYQQLCKLEGDEGSFFEKIKGKIMKLEEKITPTKTLSDDLEENQCCVRFGCIKGAQTSDFEMLGKFEPMRK